MLESYTYDPTDARPWLILLGCLVILMFYALIVAHARDYSAPIATDYEPESLTKEKESHTVELPNGPENTD